MHFGLCYDIQMPESDTPRYLTPLMWKHKMKKKARTSRGSDCVVFNLRVTRTGMTHVVFVCLSA